MTVLFLYVYNSPRSSLSVRKVALTLTAFWAVVVAGGYLALVVPNVSISTPAEMVMPASLRGNSYIYDMVHLELADIVPGASGDLVRPAAPFTYTNSWGGTFAVLLPFVLLALSRLRPGPLRTLICVLLPA